MVTSVLTFMKLHDVFICAANCHMHLFTYENSQSDRIKINNGDSYVRTV